jgi:hypothetical protein
LPYDLDFCGSITSSGLVVLSKLASGAVLRSFLLFALCVALVGQKNRLDNLENKTAVLVLLMWYFS